MSGDDRSFSRFVVIRFMLRQKLVFWVHTKMHHSVSVCFVFIGIGLHTLGANRLGLSFILKGRRVDKLKLADNFLSSLIARNHLANKCEFNSLLPKLEPVEGKRFSRRTLILKLPQLVDGKITEKGVLIVKFTETFGRLYQFINPEILTKYFRVILEPSSVGYSLPEILVWTHKVSNKVIVFSPHHNDFDLLTSIQSNLVPVTLGPADWADTSRFFQLENDEKIYDAIYVANYNPIKRVDRYIRAIVNINQKSPKFRALLVCSSHGTAHKELNETLKWGRENANIDFFKDLNQTQLNLLMNQSKVNVLFSLREGANKGLAEGLFAGVPALLMAECQCGNFRHINPPTGRIVPDAALEDALLDMAKNHSNYTPREWAMNNISSLASTKTLSDKLEEIEIAEGREWTRDLLPKVNNPELGYLNSEDEWLLPERENLLNAFARSNTDSNAADTFLKQLCERGANIPSPHHI